MRHLVFALSLFALGCNMQGLPIGVGSGASSSGDGGNGGDGGGGTVDMSKPKGGMGATCKTACDCQDGLACFQTQCQTSMFGQVYCCDSSNCPMGMFCESSTGNFGRCGMGGNGGSGGGGGGGGGGNGGMCSMIPCQSDRHCMNNGCARCDQTSGTCSAM
jgi:hypothetical protein